MFPEDSADALTFSTKPTGEVNSAKSSVLLVILLATLRRLRPESGKRQTTGNDSRIIRPPGALLNCVAEFVLSARTLERIVSPIISDLRVEYYEALAANRRAKAIWVRVRGYWSFFKALGLYSLLKTIVELWRKVSSS
jgi:hypothetical protein